MEIVLESFIFSNKIVIAVPGKIGISFSRVENRKPTFCEKSIVFMSCDKLNEWFINFKTFVTEPTDHKRIVLLDSSNTQIEYFIFVENGYLQIEKKMVR